MQPLLHVYTHVYWVLCKPGQFRNEGEFEGASFPTRVLIMKRRMVIIFIPALGAWLSCARNAKALRRYLRVAAVFLALVFPAAVALLSLLHHSVTTDGTSSSWTTYKNNTSIVLLLRLSVIQDTLRAFPWVLDGPRWGPYGYNYGSNLGSMLAC